MTDTNLNIMAVLLCAGESRRARNAPASRNNIVAKQWRILGSKAVMRHALDALAPHLRGGVVVVPHDMGAADKTAMEAATQNLPRGWRIVAGGATRALSVCAGLDALAEDGAPDFVLIHDGARPFIPEAVLLRITKALTKDGKAAVIPALPVADSLKRAQDNRITGAVPRDGLLAAQTPQGFAFDTIYNLHKRNADTGITDDSALIQESGDGNLNWVEGDAMLMKITTPDDFALAGKIAFALHHGAGMGEDD